MNKLTQQQVFSLYLANPEQRVKFQCKLKVAKEKYGIEFDIDETNKMIGMIDDQIIFKGDTESSFDISDCKLISKRISDMSEEHKVKFKRLIAKHSSKIWGWDDSQDIKKLTSTVQGISELMIFLIQNGYCIDESWITNGWVEVE